MTKICDIKIIFSIFLILFITTVSTHNLSPALCGGLHSGVDPCKECSDSQSVLVKAQTLPKPLIVDTTTNQIKSRLTYGGKRGLKFLRNRSQVLNKHSRPHLRSSLITEMKPTISEEPVQYMARVQQVQPKVPTIDPNVKLAPRFHPVGDLCFKKGSKSEPVNRQLETVIITPADPPKIECLTKSSPVMPLGYSGMENPMMRNLIISDDFSVPQLSNGFSRTKFTFQGPRRHNKVKSNFIGTGGNVNVNSASDIRMRGHTSNFHVQHSNQINSNRLTSNVMRSGVMVDNTMNRGFNVYPGSSAVIGVAPRISGVQRVPYVSPRRALVFGSGAQSLSKNRNLEVSLDTQERMYSGESASSSPSMDFPADLVSLSVAYNDRIKSCQQEAANGRGINSISTTKISEDKLSYGPQKTPINDQVEVTIKEVPEEKLHIVEKPIIEFNINKPSATLRTNEEQQHISYRDLGFKEKIYDTPIFQERINLEQNINTEEDSEYRPGYPVADVIVKGEIVPGKLPSLRYDSTHSHFTSNVGGNSAYQLLSRVQPHYQNVNEPQLRSYTVTNQNVGQLISNKQMLLPSRNQHNCYCVDK